MAPGLTLEPPQHGSSWTFYPEMHPAQCGGSETPTNSPWPSEGRREVLVRHQRAPKAHGADFLKKEMKVGVCRPCVLPLGLGHTSGPPRRCHWGPTSCPPLVFSGSLSAAATVTPEGEQPQTARPPHYTARPVCSQHLQENLTEKETEAGDSAGTRKHPVSGAQELKRDQSSAGLGAKCLLCRITSTWLAVRAATQCQTLS